MAALPKPVNELNKNQNKISLGFPMEQAKSAVPVWVF